MIAPSYPWQQVPSQQPVPVQAHPWYHTPTPMPVPVAPTTPQPARQHSVSVLLHDAEAIAPTVPHTHLAVLHGVAVLMLLHPGTGYRPAPQETQAAHQLAQGQLLTPHNGGYVLTALGHAVVAVAEANAID